MEAEDWARITMELRKAGFSDVLLAKLCDCTKQHIGKIRKGLVASPGHSIGTRLEKLHEAMQ